MPLFLSCSWYSQPWVVHCIHNPELFITSTALSCSLHPQPWAVHCIHNPDLFIESTALSCSLHPQSWVVHCIHNPELFIVFRHPWVIWLRVCVLHSLFSRPLGIQCSHPWPIHYATTLSCSLHHNSMLFISYSSRNYWYRFILLKGIKATIIWICKCMIYFRST